MKKILGFVLALALLATTSTLASVSFNRKVSVTGGSPQQLSSILAANGYTGPSSLQELTVANPSSNGSSLYLGQSDVSAANGVELLPGESITYRATNQGDVISATSIYLFTSSTQSGFVAARSK